MAHKEINYCEYISYFNMHIKLHSPVPNNWHQHVNWMLRSEWFELRTKCWDPDLQECFWTGNQMQKDHWVDPWRVGWNCFVDHNSSYRTITGETDGDDDDDDDDFKEDTTSLWDLKA